MNNYSKVALASGIVFGVGAIYAYKNDLTYDKVIDKLSENQDKFLEFVNELIQIAIETLQKIFEWIVELVRQIIFKVKLALQ